VREKLAFLPAQSDAVGRTSQITASATFSQAGRAVTISKAGSLTFPWSEFGMTAPSVDGFLNVAPTATLEFDLRLQRS
jgi:hypothetical protein